MTCNSPVEVFLRAAGAFVSTKTAFLVFSSHVITLLRSSHVPQAFFFGKNGVEVFLRAAGAFFSPQNDSQMALAIFVMGEHL